MRTPPPIDVDAREALQFGGLGRILDHAREGGDCGCV
jgi:hypothetical protein